MKIMKNKLVLVLIVVGLSFGVMVVDIIVVYDVDLVLMDLYEQLLGGIL